MPQTRKKRTRCPNGYKKHPTTNKCIKKGTTIKKRARSPNGQRKNPKTGKCEAKTKKRKIIRLPKSKKQRVTVKIKVKKKGIAKKKIIPNTTPDINKQVRQSLKRPLLYSPSINRKLATLKSASPVAVQGCPGSSIEVLLKSGKGKCLGWDSKKAQTRMLNNLVSKKPIDCSTVTAPKQAQSNCWFNSLFMTFFVSDGGRKFNRWLREAMITGKLADGRKLSKSLHRALFTLNKYINASLRSSYDKTNFADLMDTNTIIKSVYKAIGRRVNIRHNETIIAPVDAASNPLTFYRGLYETLGGDLLKWIMITPGSSDRKMADLAGQFKIYEREAFAKVIYLELFDNESGTFKKVKSFTIKRKEADGVYVYTYSLDAAILRNTSKIHFSAYITCNGQDFGFDGESFSRMQPFKWKTKLNRRSLWRFADQYETYFNFKQGYQLLIYYLVKRQLVKR